LGPRPAQGWADLDPVTPSPQFAAARLPERGRANDTGRRAGNPGRYSEITEKYLVQGGWAGRRSFPPGVLTRPAASRASRRRSRLRRGSTTLIDEPREPGSETCSERRSHPPQCQHSVPNGPVQTQGFPVIPRPGRHRVRPRAEILPNHGADIVGEIVSETMTFSLWSNDFIEEGPAGVGDK